MKKAILAIAISVGLSGTVNAVEPVFFVYGISAAIMYISGKDDGTNQDPRHFQLVDVRLKSEPGYVMETTRFDYDENIDKYIFIR